MKKKTKTRKITKTKARTRRKNPEITLDDVDRIGGNVTRELREGLFVRRRPNIFEYRDYDGNKLSIQVNRGENGILFTVRKNQKEPRYWELNEHGDDIYFFLRDLFTGEV